MKTDDLINILAEDADTQPIKISPYILMGALASTFLMLWAIGMREDFEIYIQKPMVILKHLLPWLIILAMLPFVHASFRPEYTRRVAPFLIPYVFIVILALLFGFLSTSQTNWGMAIIGKTSPYACIGYILFLSLPLFLGIFWALSKAAPAQPWRAGLGAGLLSGAIAASIYAFSCDQDHPLFFAVWYSAAIFVSGFIGAVIGHYRLRW